MEDRSQEETVASTREELDSSAEGPKKLSKILKMALTGEDRSRVVSAFVSGLTVLQPYHTAIAGSRFAIRRFGVPESLSSIYVSKFHTSMHTLNIFGILLTNLYFWVFGSKRPKYNLILSVFTHLLQALALLSLLLSYLVRWEKDLTIYYWFSTAAAFVYGLNQSFLASVAVEHLAYFLCGLQFSGIISTLLHSVLLALFKLFPSVDLNFWIVALQLLLSSLIASLALYFWNRAFGQGNLSRLLRGQGVQEDSRNRLLNLEACTENVYRDGLDNRSQGQNNGGTIMSLTSGGRTGRSIRSTSQKSDFELAETPGGEMLEYTQERSKFGVQGSEEGRSYHGGKVGRIGSGLKPVVVSIFMSIKFALSPILMSAFSMSIAFFFYPSVSPYKLTKLDHAHKIDLSILIVAAIPTIAISVLCLMGKGPNKKWDGRAFYWNYYWYLALPYVFCALSFLIAMHYRESGYSRFVRNPLVLAILADTMIVCYSILKSIGYSGAGLQGPRRNGTISTFNMLFSFLFLFTGVFWGSGYIKIYNRYEAEGWPTDGMSAFRAFAFWAKHAFEVGFSNFPKILTKDLMKDILAVTEA